MSKKYFWPIVVFILLVLCFLFYIDTQDIILKKFSLNIEFWSSLIGAIATICGIYLTLNEENKKYKEDLC